MNHVDKAIVLLELAEALLTTEMQRSKAVGPDKINIALIELTKVRHQLGDANKL